MIQPDLKAGPSAITLQPLTSIRFFAALHIFIFHLLAGHEINHHDPGKGLSFPIFDDLPAMLVNVARHGYCSTGLFFVLSGFILTYLYVTPPGQMAVDKRQFWISRCASIYPMHVLVLLAMAVGMVILRPPQYERGFDVVVSGILSAALVQAWFPVYAIDWNYPTWALSAVVFFYGLFPVLVRWMARQTRTQQIWLLAAAPVVALVPSVAYLLVNPNPGVEKEFWYEFVTRNPLLWLPHFLMGMLLSRISGINRFCTHWRADEPRRLLAWGDLAFALFVLVEACDLSTPRMILRHGLLTPLYLIMIYDLAKNRGLLARCLSLPGLQSLGKTSFALFLLQLPVQIAFKTLFKNHPLPSAVQFGLIVLTIVGLSMLSAYFLERPVTEWLRNRFVTSRGDRGKLLWTAAHQASPPQSRVV